MQSAGKAACAISLCVYVETRKPLLLRQAWKAGALLLPLSAVLLAVALSTSAAAEFACVLGSIALVAAALIGWWVCVNKKDDLVMKRAVERFNSSLTELDAAEMRLRSSLQTMLACDKVHICRHPLVCLSSSTIPAAAGRTACTSSTLRNVDCCRSVNRPLPLLSLSSLATVGSDPIANYDQNCRNSFAQCITILHTGSLVHRM